MFDFSELDATVADTFGQSVTLRRSGQEDVTITAALRSGVPDGGNEVVRVALVPAGQKVVEGDQIIVGDVVYRAGPVVNEDTGALTFRLYRQF